MRTRAHVRGIPRTPLTVAFEEAGEPLAYGAVANISVGGACVWTAAHFDVGQHLSLRLSAARQTQPLEAPAVVIWERESPDEGEQTHRYGLQWDEPSPAYQSLLRQLLAG
jgi:hypothetical protein